MTERSIADQMNDSPKHNTDRELWREVEGDYYADSIHVTEDGRIGINCGGRVLVAPIRTWHRALSGEPSVPMAGVSALVKELVKAEAEVGPRPDPAPWQVVELLRRFVDKLAVILPKVDGIIAFNSVRAGRQTYDGPNLLEELRQAKELLAALPVTPWRDISTAPQKVPLIGACISDGRVRWAQSLERIEGVWRLSDSHFAMDTAWVEQLTHWMALPVPPERPA